MLGVPSRNLPDVAHDVFLVAFRRLDRYDPSRPVRPWLLGIAHRVAADYRRRACNNREEMRAEVLPVDPAPRADTLLDQQRANEILLRALGRLSADQRVAVVLHEIEECSVPEIAEVLDVSINTVYSRLRRGRRSFSAAVKRLLPREGR